MSFRNVLTMNEQKTKAAANDERQKNFWNNPKNKYVILMCIKCVYQKLKIHLRKLQLLIGLIKQQAEEY